MTIEFATFRGGPDGVVPSKTSRPDLQEDEVLISVTASGVCGTDLHYKTSDMVLGHEVRSIYKIVEAQEG